MPDYGLVVVSVTKWMLQVMKIFSTGQSHFCTQMINFGHNKKFLQQFFRFAFDITFFFFIIIIILAIIQGLIIDAFGELRDQQEQVKDDMESKCFICKE